MLFTKVTLAAFVALYSLVDAAPVPGGTFSYGSNNDNNGFVYGSGNGGDGGQNGAIGIAVSGTKSKGSKWGSTTSSEAGNSIKQSANGGSGSAVGTFGSHNHFSRDFEERTNVDPSVAVLSNNDNNGIVVGSGNGGNGGTNVALAGAQSGAKSKGSKGWTSSSAGNNIKQSANGGSGSAVGTYGSHNWFGRDLEERGSWKSILSGNDNNGIVYGSGNGGDGGSNYAEAGAASFSSSKHSKGDTSSQAGNKIKQSANGGSGSAVGTYGSGNKFSRDVDERDFEDMEARGGSFDYLSNNDNNGAVIYSGNGGDGGRNMAGAIAVSGAKSKGSKWGSSTSSQAGNSIKQSANGGSGSAVGSFGSGNTFN